MNSYNRAFVETSWENQEESLAWLLLNNLFAIHEGWAQRLYEDIFSSYLGLSCHVETVVALTRVGV